MADQQPNRGANVHKSNVTTMISLFCEAKNNDDRSASQKKGANKKPPTATEEDRRKFVEDWVVVAEEEGINEETVGYLVDGFSLGNAEPLYRYIEKTGDHEAYGRIVTIPVIRANKAGCGLKVFMSLFPYELISPTTDNSIDVVSKALRQLLLNPSGKPWRELDQLMPALMLRPLIDNQISPNVRMDMTEAILLKDVLEQSLENTRKKIVGKRKEDSSALQKNPRYKAFNAFSDWLECQATGASYQPDVAQGAVEVTMTETNASEEIVAQHQEPCVSDKKAPDTEAAAITAPSAVESEKEDKGEQQPLNDAKPSQQHSDASNDVRSRANVDDAHDDLDMIDVLRFLRNRDRQFKDVQKTLRQRNSEIADQLSALDALKRTLDVAQRELEETQRRYQTVSDNYAALQADHESLKERHATTEKNLKEAEEFIDSIDEQASHDSESIRGSLARDLRTDFSNYVILKDQEMNEKTAMMLVQLVKQMFDVLARHGIEPKVG